MKTRKLFLLILVSAILTACTPKKNDENKIINTLDSIKAVMENNGNKKSMEEDLVDIESSKHLIKIRDYRKCENNSDVKNEYVNESELPDSLFEIAAIAEKFIKWYINDSCPIDQDKLFTFSDFSDYYIFDSEYGKYYLKELKNTKVVSDSLVRRLRKHFEQSRIDMENKMLGSETDGIIGYEADIIFNGQDLPLPIQVKEMKLESFVFYRTNEMSVGFDGVSAELIYEKGEWKIIRCG